MPFRPRFASLLAGAAALAIPSLFVVNCASDGSDDATGVGAASSSSSGNRSSTSISSLISTADCQGAWRSHHSTATWLATCIM